MSLIHWWPLNGDTQDKITGKSGTLKNGGVVNSIGKVSMCYSSNNNHNFTSNTWSCADGIEVLNGSLVGEVEDEYSFACWFRVHGKHGQYQSCIMSSGDWNAGNCWVIGFNQTNTAVFCPVNDYNTGKINLSSALVNDQWYHLATVYKNGVSTAYLDGTKIGEVSAQGIYQSSSTTAYIGRDQAHGGFFPYNGDINDLRIYDHALSQAEIKELAKALVVHYTFDDILIEPTTNLLTGNRPTFGNLSTSITSVYDNGKHTITSSANAGTFRLTFPLAILTTGATYYFSCKYRIVEGANFTFDDWCDSALSEKTIEDRGDYKYISMKCYTTRTYNNTYRFMDGTISASTTVEVWDLQLQTNSLPTPYTEQERTSQIHNETGFMQPHELKDVGLTTDAVTGKYALQCNSSYIVQHSIGDGTHGATASMWIKMPLTSNWIAFVDSASGLGFGCYSRYGVIASVSRTNRRRVSNLSSLWKTNDWNHVVVTISSDNKTNRCWINGVEGTYGDPDHWTHNNDSFVIGSRYGSAYGDYPSTIKMDDFRMYYTCLSDDEVQRLYTSRGYATNYGDLCVGELVEDKEEILIKSNGQCTSKEIWEHLPYVETTGAMGYFDTEYAPTSNDYSIELDVQVKSFTSFDTLAGFMYTGSTSPRCGIHIYGSKYMFGANATTQATTPLPENDRGGDRIVLKAVFKTGAQKLYRNGELIASNSTSFNHSSNLASIWLLERNNYTASTGASAPVNPSNVKLYEAKIYEGDTVVRHYIPWYHSGKQCLYDLCTNTFLDYTGTVKGLYDNNIELKFYDDDTITTRQVIEI